MSSASAATNSARSSEPRPDDNITTRATVCPGRSAHRDLLLETRHHQPHMCVAAAHTCPEAQRNAEALYGDAKRIRPPLRQRHGSTKARVWMRCRCRQGQRDTYGLHNLAVFEAVDRQIQKNNMLGHAALTPKQAPGFRLGLT